MWLTSKLWELHEVWKLHGMCPSLGRHLGTLPPSPQHSGLLMGCHGVEGPLTAVYVGGLQGGQVGGGRSKMTVFFLTSWVKCGTTDIFSRVLSLKPLLSRKGEPEDTCLSEFCPERNLFPFHIKEEGILNLVGFQLVPRKQPMHSPGLCWTQEVMLFWSRAW